MTVAAPSAVPSGSIWIFGFGSLVHSPGFEFKGRVEGFIRGYRRVFWQGSTDHRGHPGAPGRVATLHEDPEAVTWGVAYELAGSHEEQERTLHYLEWREKQYDIRRHVSVWAAPGDARPAVEDALVYIAGPDPGSNPDYLGPAPLATLAHTVATAEGPSGPNHVYLFRLANGLRMLGMDDPGVFELEEAVKARMAELGLECQSLEAPSNPAADHAVYWESVAKKKGESAGA
ncbi:hypothetical protein ACKKBF_B21445 [Auxenochlorella protothecoides x Auxenochlorella symbiontica]